jgi:hypothetical protein
MFQDCDDQLGLHGPCFGPVELIGPTNSVMGLLGLSGVIIFSTYGQLGLSYGQMFIWCL